MARNQKVDLTGAVFSDLTVLDGTTRPECLVRCVCGKEFMAHVSRMKIGQRKNCGCKRAENIRAVSRPNVTGLVYGKLTCVDNYSEGNKRLWLCECGKQIMLKLGDVVSGNTRSCGCLRVANTLACVICGREHTRAPSAAVSEPTCSRECMSAKKKRDSRNKLIGEVFGRLTVVEFAGLQGARNRPYWKCHCVCGVESVVAQTHLFAKKTHSCGCQTREASSKTGILNCRKNNMGASTKRWCISVEGRMIRLRSGFEYIYVQHLLATGTPFEYEPQVFKLAHGCRYLPDFYLPKTDEWVEVKGHMTERAVLKHKLFREAGYKLVVLQQAAIGKLLPRGQTFDSFYKMHKESKV